MQHLLQRGAVTINLIALCCFDTKLTGLGPWMLNSIGPETRGLRKEGSGLCRNHNDTPYSLYIVML